MGGRVRLDGDSLVCEGVGQLRGADLSSFNDHRVLMALAVAGSKRLAALPDVPTLSELGVTGVDVVQWYGLFAPAGTPAAVVSHLNQALNEVLADPDVVRRFESQGALVEPGSPDALALRMKSDLARWREVVRQAGIAPKEQRQFALD